MKALAVVWPTLGLLVALFLQSRPASQTLQAPRMVIDVQKLGPQVGERVPGFSLKDQTGKDWTLESIMGPNGAMIVFIRSADW